MATQNKPKRYENLFRAIEECGAVRILEIGVHRADRAVEMIEWASAMWGHRCVPEYFGFDLFLPPTEEQRRLETAKRQPPLSLEEAWAKLNATGAKIHLFPGNTRDTLPTHAARLPRMDFIFIDGGHSLETIANDWEHCRELMHGQTRVIFDDLYPGNHTLGCLAEVEKIQQDLAYRVKILDPEDVFDNGLRIRMAQVMLAVGPGETLLDMEHLKQEAS